MIIHKEGRSLLPILFSVLVLLNIGIEYIIPDITIVKVSIWVCSSMCFLFVLQFFRSPVFEIACNEKHILAPADGKIVIIEEVKEVEHLKEKRIQISIFMSPFNVHVNRMPVEGEMTYSKYHPGKYLVAWHPKSSLLNERNTVAIKMQNGTKVLLRQIAGAVARRIKCYISVGQTLKQGQEFGFIKFGSRVDIFLPLNTIIKVKMGDKTIGGKTILGEL